MPKYKIVLRWLAGFVMFWGIGSAITISPENIMQQIYAALAPIPWFVFACAPLLF